ncbi:polysaccharide-degrading enzyme [Brevifollis gellanilyticus]|uniref:Right handed beta helix domain-containing protein n=1 Tax=Brevifollis gellanilyticus TaxID=748831 RepID=A0A512M5E9_9BACT|nr:polysaccharide-degrading enzyme [Brevifollis gellanilyticus]GEP41946.1 hypothetical protein BGE01nite_12370 [Brevifollis gellanilyticus]
MKLLTSRFPFPICLLAALTMGSARSKAAVYEVGPGKEHPSIGSVPWEALGAGDTVRIHWRSKPYQEKFIVFGRGTAEKPITISGVPGPKGQLPVIDGRDASTRPQLKYWGQERGVFKIGGSNHSTTTPGHIIVENLEIRSARRPYTFSGRRGAEVYKKDAASLNVEIVEHLVLRNLTLHDSSNGLMVSPQSKDVRVEGCHIYDNGNPDSISEHNAYSEAIGMVYEGNHFGPLREGCRGNNLKDRSAGLVVKNNWIEGGNRQLDLVEAMGNSAILYAPEYRLTKVYGNVLIELEGPGNNQVVHYGGDMGDASQYRKGVLQFYNNTVVSYRVKPTALFRVSSEDETVECWNNIVYAKSGKGALSLMVTVGTLKLGKNWLSSGWAKSHEDFKGSVDVLEPALEGEEPGFVDLEQRDFLLKPGSPCLNAAATLPKGWTLPDSRYLKHQKVEKLPEGAPRSLGAP